MLEASHLSLQFKRRTLFQGVSLTLRPGEVLALLGPNGTGKSSLVKILAGDLAPTAGTVRLDRRPLAAWTLAELALRRAVLPQESRLAFPFAALDVVTMGRYACHGGYPSDQDRRVARAAMDELDVAHLHDRLYPTLSGGERARVQLCRVLCQLRENGVSSPKTLLLDEPTASLDLAHQHTALGAARRFARAEGAAVCAVLHDLNLAALYADRIALLAEGRIFAEGRPEEVLTAAVISAGFGTPVVVQRHPVMDCPWVATLPNVHRLGDLPKSPSA